MHRAELLKTAAQILGRPVRTHHLEYAVRCGYVTPQSRRPDGWYLYGQDAVDSLVGFMRERSRSGIAPTS